MADEEQPKGPEPPGGWLPPQPPGAPPPPPLPQRPEMQPPPAAPPPEPPEPPEPPVPHGGPPPGMPGGSPPSAPPSYAPPPLPNDPGNGNAVAGFTCAVVGASLLVLSMGLSSILSLILGIIALPTSRAGKKAVKDGVTRKSEGLANAGWIVGIITVVLSILATVVWILLIVVLDSIDWEELEEDSDGDGEPVLRGAVAVLAASARLIA